MSNDMIEGSVMKCIRNSLTRLSWQERAMYELEPFWISKRCLNLVETLFGTRIDNDVGARLQQTSCNASSHYSDASNDPNCLIDQRHDCCRYFQRDVCNNVSLPSLEGGSGERRWMTFLLGCNFNTKCQHDYCHLLTFINSPLTRAMYFVHIIGM